MRSDFSLNMYLYYCTRRIPVVTFVQVLNTGRLEVLYCNDKTVTVESKCTTIEDKY